MSDVDIPVCPTCGDQRLSVDVVVLEAREVVGWRNGAPEWNDHVFDTFQTEEVAPRAPYTCYGGHEFATPRIVQRGATDGRAVGD